MKFGNWQVTQAAIVWKGFEEEQYEITADNLTATRRIGNSFYYDSILSAINEDFLTQDDLYDLNYAFIYAVAKLNIDFDYQVFDATLEEQFERLDVEDREEDAF